MAAIFPNFPQHGDGDWDDPLLTGLGQIVTLLNQHDIAITTGLTTGTGTGSGASNSSIVQNADGSYTLTINGAISGGTTTGGITATLNGSTVTSLNFSSDVKATDLLALPLPSGTPVIGQVAAVSAVSPLATTWTTPSTSTSTSSGSGNGSTTTLRPESYGAKSDGVILTDLVVTSGSTAISSPTGPFTSTAVDQGKVVYWRSGNVTWASGIIASVQSSTNATLASAASSGIQSDGGPNPNSVFGTDSTAAFNACYAAAQNVPLANTSQYRPYVTPGREVRLSAGVYIVKPLNTLTGWNVRTSGEGRYITMVACVEAGAIWNIGTFDVNASYAFPSTTLNWAWNNMTLINPVYSNGGALSTRGQITTGIQDNGNGSVTLENMSFKGFKYGYASPYGGDFTRHSDIYYSNCDVGSYMGPGGQQVEFNNIDYSDCREGAVWEGVQNWHMGGNCHFQDPRFSAVTIEGKASGSTTRFGVQSNIGGGAFYNGRMTIDGNPWFETNSGNNGNICPRMIYMNGDGPYGQGVVGLTVRDALLIAGGTQVPSGTNAFLEIVTNYTEAQPFIIENLYVGGTYINYIVNSTGNATNIKPLLKYLRYDTTKIALQRNASGYKYISEDGNFHGYTAN